MNHKTWSTNLTKAISLCYYQICFDINVTSSSVSSKSKHKCHYRVHRYQSVRLRFKTSKLSRWCWELSLIAHSKDIPSQTKYIFLSKYWTEKSDFRFPTLHTLECSKTAEDLRLLKMPYKSLIKLCGCFTHIKWQTRTGDAINSTVWTVDLYRWGSFCY